MIAKSWLGRCWEWKIVGCVALVGSLSVGVSENVLAQIVPDNTLGAEQSVVTPSDIDINGIPSNQIDQIRGGATRGANLFHSFQEFNVNAGRGAYFTNPAGVNNIFGRVTGGNPSNIQGTLGVTGGNANLFLINPNGIVFGHNAKLDLAGSFVATSANAIQFPNGEVFSASTPEVPSSLLTVNPSAFLFNQVSVGAITNQSVSGLQVPDVRSLLLLGGNINLDGGALRTPGGRIELGGVAGIGTVGLNANGNNLSLSFPNGVERADISLSNGAVVDASGEGGGDIRVQGRRITLSNASQIVTSTLGETSGGTLEVTASDAIEVIGNGSGLFATTTGNGDADDLRINSRQLIVRDGAVISNRSTGLGRAGDITINVIDTLEANNGTIASSTDGAGDAGDLRINSRQLIVHDGAVIFNRSTGQGRAGDIAINVDTLEANNGTIASSASQTSSGDITINAARRIYLSGNSHITTNIVQGTGDAGNITLSAGFIAVFDNSKIRAFSIAGRDGNITITSYVLIGFGFFTGIDEFYRPESRGINTDNLIATSCIARRGNQGNTFFITGADSLPQRPGDVSVSHYPTVNIDTLPTEEPSNNSSSSINNPSTTRRPWKKGDPIIEPQGVYRLPNGKLVLSRDCF